MIDIDPILKDAITRGTIDLKASPSDHFSTAGGLQYDFGDNPRRLRSGHVLDLNGATLELDPDRVTDEMLKTGNPLIMLGSEIGNIAGKSGDDAYNAISTGITVKNANLIANFSKLAPRAQALGLKQFAITGVGLQGHDAHIDVTLRDFGAYGREGFPAWIVGADNAFDSHALYSVDPARTLRPATLKYKFRDFAPGMSTDQVTVGMATGVACPANLQESPWSMSGPWRYMWRESALLEPDVECPPSKSNLVQGATAYLCNSATIDGRTLNARIGYYSDYYRSKGVHILPTCSFRGCDYGAQIQLSPTAGEYPDLPPTFSAEDFVIEKFDCDARISDVYLNADLLPGVKMNPQTRYLRNMAVDARLRVSGNKEGLVLIPAPNTSRAGCVRRFFPL